MSCEEIMTVTCSCACKSYVQLRTVALWDGLFNFTVAARQSRQAGMRGGGLVANSSAVNGDKSETGLN
jgi:hypothetical protein